MVRLGDAWMGTRGALAAWVITWGARGARTVHVLRVCSVCVRACVQVKGDNHVQTMDAIQHVVDKVVKRHKEGECRS